jgi:hypothetical protein
MKQQTIKNWLYFFIKTVVLPQLDRLVNVTTTTMRSTLATVQTPSKQQQQQQQFRKFQFDFETQRKKSTNPPSIPECKALLGPVILRTKKLCLYFRFQNTHNQTTTSQTITNVLYSQNNQTTHAIGQTRSYLSQPIVIR